MDPSVPDHRSSLSVQSFHLSPRDRHDARLLINKLQEVDACSRRDQRGREWDPSDCGVVMAAFEAVGLLRLDPVEADVSPDSRARHGPQRVAEQGNVARLWGDRDLEYANERQIARAADRRPDAKRRIEPEVEGDPVVHGIHSVDRKASGCFRARDDDDRIVSPVMRADEVLRLQPDVLRVYRHGEEGAEREDAQDETWRGIEFEGP